MYNTIHCGANVAFSVKLWTSTGREVVTLDRDEFQKLLRDALNHLWDPSYLQRTTLISVFDLEDRVNAATGLRRLLVDAIESLEPDAAEPPHSRAWRIYESLYYRYVQQLSQAEIADQLGISPRQLRREQRDALDVLATRLWKRFDVGTKQLVGPREEPASSVASEVSSSIRQELSWLKGAPLETPTDPGKTLPAVIELIRPLATQQRVQLQLEIPRDLPQLAVNPVAVRQILLNLLGVAVSRTAAHNQVIVSVDSLPWELDFTIRRTGPAPDRPLTEDERSTIAVAEEMVRICGGRIQLHSPEQALCARLSLPILEQLPILAIDDNAHTLQLLQRYTAGTRYRLIGAQNPENALSLAEEISPQVIVLDVMMPHIDGWELLGRLRQHPVTAHLPIVVCTILAQEKLALSLGASSLLRKPVTRQAFLSALDEQIAQRETESH